MNERSAPLLTVIAAALLFSIFTAAVLSRRTGTDGSDEGSSDAIRRTHRASARSNSDPLPEADAGRTALGQHLPDLPAHEAIGELLALADKDLSAAFELALGLGASDGSDETVREALRELIGRDLASAIAWGEQRPPSPEMELFWAAAVDLTAGAEPALAFELSLRTGGELRRSLLEDVFAEWAGEDPEAAKRAAGRLGPDEGRLESHVALLATELDRDLGATLAWIESVEDLDLQDALYYHAVQHWAAGDPSAAAGFADSLVESDYKTLVAGRVLESWVRSDADSAMAWASQLPDQESREEAITRGIRQTLEVSPERAATLALNLPGEGDRAAALEWVVSAWIEQDRAALAKWLDGVPDSAAQARLRQMMDDHLAPAK